MSDAFTSAAQTGRDGNQELELKKLEIEKLRVEGDLRLREEELKLKREELQLRKKEQGATGFLKFNAVTATIAVALIGALGTAIVAVIQDQSKFESDLILKATVTGNPDESTQNLLFLLDAGFIRDPKGKIAALAKNPSRVFVLPPVAYTSGAFEGIPAEGVGGDAAVNVLRNRDLPPKQFTLMTLEKIGALPTPNVPDEQSSTRSSWPQEILKEVNGIGSQGVMVEGYIARVRVVAPTAANARREGLNDWTLSLVSDPSDEIAKSVTAAITPRVRSAHPDWTLEKLQELSQARQKVRISGWLLFGPDLWKHIGQAATRWRIHPVLNVEIQSGQGWIKLSDAP